MAAASVPGNAHGWGCERGLERGLSIVPKSPRPSPPAAGLVAELSLPREHHRHPVLVRRTDDLFVAYRSTRLHDRANARLCRLIDAIAEWEEGVGAEHG